MNQDSHSGNTPPDTDSSLAGQYVLGAMSEQERRDFEVELSKKPALQKAVNDWQEHFLAITDQLEEVPAPLTLASRVKRSVDALDTQPERAVKQSSTGFWSFWNSLALWRGFSAACLVLAVAVGLQSQHVQPTVADPAYIAVLVAPEDKKPGWVIQTNQANEMRLVPLGVIEIPEGKALQFWTKAEGWDTPVSLGLVKKGESISVAIDQLPPLTENQLFELTLEQETGSPTGLPTGPIKSIGRGVITM